MRILIVILMFLASCGYYEPREPDSSPDGSTEPDIIYGVPADWTVMVPEHDAILWSGDPCCCCGGLIGKITNIRCLKDGCNSNSGCVCEKSFKPVSCSKYCK